MLALSPVEVTTDVLVIGGGIAGMVAALRAAEAGAQVLLLAKSAPGTECNSAVSGGGFLMACTNPSLRSRTGLSEAEHCQLTKEAGCQINQPELADALSRNAPECREWLESTIGFALNVKDNGKGYWCPGGGANLSAKLAEAVAQAECITVRTLRARELLAPGDVCYGVLAEDHQDGTQHRLTASATVLATGGYAGLFARHDNPGAPIGAGVVMAARTGARLRDLEFVQFYPVAVDEPGLPTFMLFRPFPPEVRLVTAHGRDLLAEHFGGMDLNQAIGAERDELSKVIHAENQRGQVYFDATGFDWSQMDRWFSLRYTSRHDFDWANARAKVAPIAHHTMGGVWIDARARTSLDRLYAAGEVTGGVHGANRHGSNSLTDCLVFGSIASNEAAGETSLTSMPGGSASPTASAPERAAFPELQRICWEGLGIVRDAAGMSDARHRLTDLPASDARLMAEMITAFATRRTESRGAHFRTDYPTEEQAWQRSQIAHLVDDELQFEPVDE